MKGCDVLCATLEELGAGVVFGVAGTQNVDVFESLRNSNIRVVAATDEKAAAFMAVGWYRATGEPGVVITIPGPGFTYALPAIAEARLDSCAILIISIKPVESPRPMFQLQDIDQRAMAAPIVKHVFAIDETVGIPSVLAEARALALAGEPGPVFVEISRGALRGECEVARVAESPARESGAAAFQQILESLLTAKRPAIYAGQGALGAAGELVEFAEWLGVPVFLTTSARGAVPEDHPCAFPIDRAGARWDLLNETLAGCDCVLAIGVKFTHNGSGGYRLKLKKESLIHADSAPHVLNANYPARLAVETDAPELLQWLAARSRESRAREPRWNGSELIALQSRLLATDADPCDPKFVGLDPPVAATFYDALRRALPRDGIVTTDSGMHQLVARRHFTVLSPRSFIVPTDFQSMGFSIPAATAAKIAFPNRPVVALLGDAGFAMMGLELLVARRENIAFTAIVFNDRQAGLIRIKQIQEYGHSHGTEIINPDFAKFAQSIGVDYIKIDGDPEPNLRAAIGGGKLTIVEVPLEDSSAMKSAPWKHAARETVDKVKGVFRKLI
ncbi:MAG: thiamine pyrophosphate-binding protein [Planctomycetes bacterium]|nr:thiamine pyrophosphate-binding protein [Planctomycetota bacterium]